MLNGLDEDGSLREDVWKSIHNSSHRSLFLFYLRDSIDQIFNHQVNHNDHHRADVVAGLSADNSSVTESAAVAGHMLLAGPTTNITSWNDYQYFDESTISDSMFNRSDAVGDELSENFSSPYLMPWPQRSAWISVFTLMLIVATVGNTLVAWIVLGQFLRTGNQLVALMGKKPKPITR